MKYSNVLITGGAGFIGSNLALKLINLGYNITILDNLSVQIHSNNPEKSSLYNSIKSKVIFFKGDITDKVILLKALSNQDAIIHLAAETGTGQSMYEIERYNSVNIMGTALLWDILANCKHSIKKVVVASSRAIYGEGKYNCEIHGIVYPEARNEIDMANGDFNVKCPYCNSNVFILPTSEDSKIHPTSIYGFTKQAQEQMSMIAGKALKIPIVSFRYQNVYGPGQSLSNPYTGILSIFSTRLKNNNDISIFEDGIESRDFVYIDDVVSATIAGLESDMANYECFNVGNGIPINVLTIANTLKKLFNSSININITGNFRLGDIRSNFADLTKISYKLKYTPKFDFETGISNFVNWVNSQEIKSDNYEKSLLEMKQKGLYK